MKFFFALICILGISVTLVMGQGAEGFNRFQDKSTDFNSGSYVGENGVNWDFNLCKNYIATGEGGIRKSGLELKNDSTAEISSSVISGGIGLLKLYYSTTSTAPVKLDVFINRTKIATFSSDSSAKDVVISTDDILVNLDKPFSIRIKQANETSGQVIIEKVLWSKYASVEYGTLYADTAPAKPGKSTLSGGLLTESSVAYHIYPNPAKEFIAIEMTENKNVTVKLFTLAGQMVLQEQVKGSEQKINIGNLKEGLYIYKILDDKGKLITGKLIIR